MERYYYHGVGDNINLEYVLPIMCSIIENGIKSRKKLGSKYNHVCLYQKNPDGDYESAEWFLKSARGGWIDNCFGFIINPNINAIKVEQDIYTGFNEKGNPVTNLIDEYRSIGDIPITEIAGIFMPNIQNIIEIIKAKEKIYENGYKNEMKKVCITLGLDEKFQKMNLFQMLNFIIEYANYNNLIIADSCEKNFVDKLDDNLNSKKL